MVGTVMVVVVVHLRSSRSPHSAARGCTGSSSAKIQRRANSLCPTYPPYVTTAARSFLPVSSHLTVLLLSPLKVTVRGVPYVGNGHEYQMGCSTSSMTLSKLCKLRIRPWRILKGLRRS